MMLLINHDILKKEKNCQAGAPPFSHKDRDSAVKKTTKERNISEKREKRESVNLPVMQYMSKNVLPHTFFDRKFT